MRFMKCYEMIYWVEFSLYFTPEEHPKQAKLQSLEMVESGSIAKLNSKNGYSFFRGFFPTIKRHVANRKPFLTP